MLQRTFLLLFSLLFSANLFAQTEVRITNADLAEGQNYTWSSSNVYILDELVFVKPGSELTIEPGTVIKGATGEGNNATGLVVTRGAKIFAQGTPSNPIIFTSELDDLSGSLTEADRGLWAGVVILGAAPTNNPAEKLVEGVNEIANPESLAAYGGTEVNDNSGVFRYVSIRHTGIQVGDVAGNEIQGLTLGGVGAGTVIEYVESFASNDDGFEWFGGTVNTKYLVSSFNTDDAYDWDEGFRGKHQFWFAIQSNSLVNDGFGRAAEMDGATGDENTEPFAKPIISNVTYLGAGLDVTSNAGDGSQLLMFRDNTGGEYYNSIFSDQNGRAITIEAQGKVSGFDSKTRLETGDLVLQNNLWGNFGAGNTIDAFAGGDDQAHTRAYLSDAANANRVADPALRGISRVAGSNGLDPRPSASSPALASTGVKSLSDSFFTPTNYVGAFGSTNWMQGWTALDQLGYLGNLPSGNTSIVEISNSDLVAGQNYTWSTNNTYILKDMVFVKPGSELTIEPGTVIKGALGEGSQATGLVVTRGAKIFAQGSPSNPIIFTTELDDLSGSLTEADRGLWAGVVILGAAPTNNPAEKLVEGVNEIANPESLAAYGGTEVNDNSGVFRYVSIRHTGIQVGDVAGNEIQGLTLGGVGAGTTIEYVESFASNDDGFEWFGGTVNTKYLVSAFNTDDAYDWDEGFRGKHQFWFAIQSNSLVNDGFGRAAEMDGATGDENTEPFAKPIISNVTYLGAGLDVTSNAGDGSQLLMFRDNTGGEYYNSIFSDQNGRAITIEAQGKVSGFDSKTRLETGDLVLQNNLWGNFGAGNTIDAFAGGDDQAHTRAYLSDAANANRVADPALRGISRVAGSNGLDPRPTFTSPARDVDAVKNVNSMDSYFERVNYVGAFGSTNWMQGWTALDQLGYLGDINSGDAATLEISDSDLAAGGDFYWTANNTYILQDMVFVRPGSRLFIEAGTVVKGALGEGSQATGLVVTRGGKIYAQGTSENPIIFTTELDDLSGSLTEADRGLWAGVVILGAAPTNNPAEKLVEGVNEIANPSSLAAYGGNNDEDNSGIFRYVSIRHTGIQVGDVAGNEIQGLTLGGVGSGTVIEYVESFASNDDGFEWFGGTVNTKYLVSAFNTDDAYDWDEGFRGKHQYWFAIQSNSLVNDGFGRAAEMDGATGDENTEPFAKPIISNVTYLGAGLDVTSNAGDGSQLLIFRDNTGGEYYNSIFSDQNGRAITIEAQGKVSGFDSKTRLETGDLVLQNNIWYGFGAGNTIDEFASGDDQAHTRAYLSDAANGNRAVDPLFRGISREAGSGNLDPRPGSGSPALDAGSVKDLSADSFFDNPGFTGAFDGSAQNWMQGWTALDQLGYITRNAITSISDDVELELPTETMLSQNYPNPFNPSTTISFSIPQAQNVRLNVYDVMGREVASIVNARLSAGSYNFNFDASNLSTGMYIYRLTTGNTILTRKMTLIK